MQLKKQKKTKNSRDKGVRIIAHAQKRNPLSDLYNILRTGRYLDVITRANFVEDRLKDF